MSDDPEPDPRPYASGVGDTSGSRHLERRRKKEAAREKLEQIQALEDPVERIIRLAEFFRRGPGDHLTSELDMEKLLDKAQARAREGIRATANEKEEPKAYLKSVLSGTHPDLVDDYVPWTAGGLIKTVRRSAEALLEQYSFAREENDGVAPETPYPLESDELPADFFEGRPTLRKQCEAVVEIWKDPDRTIETDMGKLKKYLDQQHRNGDSVVTTIQNRLRSEDINDEYEHRNAQSFCKLVKRLLRLDASR